MGWLDNPVTQWVAQTFNPQTASQWYAQQSAQNWRGGNPALAIANDFVGGYVGAWTGATSSPAQAWWSAGWSVPVFFVGGAAKNVLGAVNTSQAISTAYFTAGGIASGHTPLNWQTGLQVGAQLVGFSGNLAESASNALRAPQGQFLFDFANSNANKAASLLNYSRGASAGTAIFGFNDPINQTFGNNIQHFFQGLMSSGNSAAGNNTAQVGGILFDHCATLCGIDELQGAFWDAASNSIVIAGRSGTSIVLSQVERDHLEVALRAAVVGRAIGVSIDPPAKYRQDGATKSLPPDGTNMLVSYLGNTEKTLFGAIMFEADRLLKCLTKGTDNETGTPRRSSVEGYQSILDMHEFDDIGTDHTWTRFWFVTDKAELTHDAASNSMMFSNVRLKVLTESEMEGRSAQRPIDRPSNGDLVAERVNELSTRFEYRGKYYYVDPSGAAEWKTMPKADAIFITGAGVDLVDQSVIRLISKRGTLIVTHSTQKHVGEVGQLVAPGEGVRVLDATARAITIGFLLEFGARKVRVPEDAEVFARRLTRDYDKYAIDFPVLARLKELAKIASLAKLLINQNVKIGLWDLFSSPRLPSATPAVTKGITVSKRDKSQTRSVSIFGGVDMDPDIIVSPDTNHVASAFRAQVVSTRPKGFPTSWSVDSGKSSSQSAVMINLGGLQPFRHIGLDYLWASRSGEPQIGLRRVYDSSLSASGDFGPGWRFFVPFSIAVIQTSGKRPEVLTSRDGKEKDESVSLILHDMHARESHLYMRVSDKSVGSEVTYCRVISQRRQKKRGSIELASDDKIVSTASGFTLKRKGREFVFGMSGQLQEIQIGKRSVTRLTWVDDRLTRVDSPGGAFSVVYSSEEVPRVTGIKTSDGHTIVYHYNHSGLLCKRVGGNQPFESYGYDNHGRLTEIRDATKRVLKRATYGKTSVVEGSLVDQIVSPTGGEIRREIRSGCLQVFEDRAGTEARCQYGARGELNSLVIENRTGTLLRADYDESGRLASLTNNQNRTARWHYSADGRLGGFETGAGERCELNWDEAGRLTGFAKCGGTKFAARYDESGALQEILGSDGRRLSVRYANSIPIQITAPDSTLQVLPRKTTLMLTLKATSGNWQKVVYDRHFRIVEWQNSGAKKMRFQHKPAECLIKTEAGATRISSDQKSMTMTVSFE